MLISNCILAFLSFICLGFCAADAFKEHANGNKKDAKHLFAACITFLFVIVNSCFSINSLL